MIRRLLPATTLAFLLAACGPRQEIAIDHVFVRLAAVPGRPAAAYFTVHGGAAPSTLIAVSADAALRTEMHESAMKDGVMTMAPLARVTIPAHQDVAFAPGGRHAMLFGVNPKWTAGSRMALTFTFADSTRMTANAPVIAAGDPAPKD